MLRITYACPDGHIESKLYIGDLKNGVEVFDNLIATWIIEHPLCHIQSINRVKIVVEKGSDSEDKPDNFQLEETQYNVVELLGLDSKHLWGLFDGHSSSQNGRQFVMGLPSGTDKLHFLKYEVDTNEFSPDLGLDGDIIAVVYEDTKKFEQWTPNAALLVSAPVFLETLREIANGESHHNPGVLATAALQYFERIKNHGKNT